MKDTKKSVGFTFFQPNARKGHGSGSVASELSLEEKKPIQIELQYIIMQFYIDCSY